MDWDEPEDLRPRYRLCQAGFALLALGLGLLCGDAALDFAYWCSGSPAIAALVRDPLWTWLVGAPITWGTLVGSFLLWGRWTEPSWQRRAGLLLLMNGIDLVHWTLRHGDALGLRIGELPHGWLRSQLSGGMGWIELALSATLAADLSVHLGRKEAPDSSRGARALAMVGLVVWGLFFLQHTHWRRWPLRPRNFLTPETYLLLIGQSLLLAITAFQVTALCILAARQCGHYLRELDRIAADRDRFLLPSEPDPDGRPSAPDRDDWYRPPAGPF